mmetsp:Transcript_21106/g.15449  ORF Transcript_21106/g.15449 Transcript_21106/m.15449 type:complete len:86 (-) Transcript_21106:231-488(-)
MQELINDKNAKLLLLAKEAEKKSNLNGFLKNNYKFLSDLLSKYFSLDVGNGYSSGLFSLQDQQRIKSSLEDRLYKVGSHFCEAET